MKYIRLFLTTLVFTLVISGTVFAYPVWDVSGTYYNKIYESNNAVSSAYYTQGVCTLYVSKGDKYSIYISPRYGDGTGSQCISFKNNQDGLYTYDDNSGYKSYEGWRSLKNITFDGTPTTWLLCLNNNNGNIREHLRQYYNGSSYITSAYIWNECRLKVTVNVRQNPSTCSQTHRCSLKGEAKTALQQKGAYLFLAVTSNQLRPINL